MEMNLDSAGELQRTQHNTNFGLCWNFPVSSERAGFVVGLAGAGSRVSALGKGSNLPYRSSPAGEGVL